MLVHHLRMLDRHHANYNKQDTVLAQLLYHLNTAHINASTAHINAGPPSPDAGPATPNKGASHPNFILAFYNMFHICFINSIFNIPIHNAPLCQLMYLPFYYF